MALSQHLLGVEREPKGESGALCATILVCKKGHIPEAAEETALSLSRH
jgi:hypothetical protein